MSIIDCYFKTVPLSNASRSIPSLWTCRSQPMPDKMGKISGLVLVKTSLWPCFCRLLIMLSNPCVCITFDSLAKVPFFSNNLSARIYVSGSEIRRRDVAHVDDDYNPRIKRRGLANTRHEIFHSRKHQAAIRGEDKIFRVRSLFKQIDIENRNFLNARI